MNDHAPPRQTRSFLMRRFEEAGIRPKTKFGQNFLIDLNLLDILLRAGDIGPDDVVLEVGGGTGALTAMMARLAAHVVTVEIDPQLFQLAREELYQLPNVTMLQQDALKSKSRVSPIVMDAVQQKVAEFPGQKFKLVANLPYHIATPLISNLLAGDPVPYMMVVTIQRELGERMIARPSTREYSALSIWVQSQCDVEMVRIMPPTVFWPQPKVESAIMKITVRPDLRARIADLPFFHRFVRSIFFHRRKFLRSELLSAFKNQLDKPAVDAVMAELGHGPTARAEELDIPAVIALASAIRRRVPDDV